MEPWCRRVTSARTRASNDSPAPDLVLTPVVLRCLSDAPSKAEADTEVPSVSAEVV